MSKNRILRNHRALALLQVFNGLSALAGGVGLMSDPSGGNVAMYTSWLEGTPFTNFLIPGIILFVVNGIGNVTGFVMTLRKHHRASEVGWVFGAVMMGWIIVQVLMIGYMSFLQPLYFTTGVLQLYFGYALRTAINRRSRSE